MFSIYINLHRPTHAICCTGLMQDKVRISSYTCNDHWQETEQGWNLSTLLSSPTSRNIKVWIRLNSFVFASPFVLNASCYSHVVFSFLWCYLGAHACCFRIHEGLLALVVVCYLVDVPSGCDNEYFGHLLFTYSCSWKETALWHFIGYCSHLL